MKIEQRTMTIEFILTDAEAITGAKAFCKSLDCRCFADFNEMGDDFGVATDFNNHLLATNDSYKELSNFRSLTGGLYGMAASLHQMEECKYHLKVWVQAI